MFAPSRRRLTGLQLSLALLGIIAGAALVQLYLDGGGATLVSALFLLEATALAFFYATIRQFPGIHHLPFLWASLALIEFVISPTIDTLSGAFSAGTPNSFLVLERATLACALFIGGTWMGIRASTHRAGQRVEYPVERGATVAIPHRFYTVVLLVIAAVALVTSSYVLVTSGAIAGELRDARGAGLLGTTVLLPLVRLGDISTLLSSWLAICSASSKSRRAYRWISIACLTVSLIMPIALQQRFGVLQALAYFAMPLLATGRWLPTIRNRALLGAVPIALCAGFLANGVTALAREAVMGGDRLAYGAIASSRVLQAESGTHFRHMRLLATLIESGADEPEFGGVYAGTPFLGDVLIFLPRALFPDKPLTTMEVVNTLALGRRFIAADRGTSAIFTSSLWAQLYLLGGLYWMLPLGALFSFGAMRAWHWAMKRSGTASGLTIAAVLWVQLGWLSYNVAFTTLETPGMLLAVALLGALPIRTTWNSRPEVKNFTRGNGPALRGVGP